MKKPSDIWTRLPRHKWPKSWSDIEDPVVPLEQKFVRTPTCWSLVGKTVRGSSNGTSMGKSPELGMNLIDNKDFFISIRR